MNEFAPTPGEQVPPVGAQVDAIFTPADERAAQEVDLANIAKKIEMELAAINSTPAATTEALIPGKDDPQNVLSGIEARNDVAQASLGLAVDKAVNGSPDSPPVAPGQSIGSDVAMAMMARGDYTPTDLGATMHAIFEAEAQKAADQPQQPPTAPPEEPRHGPQEGEQR